MSEENNKIRTVHNIVYSVKGGCGKTSFSLFLTLSNLYFDRKARKIDFGREWVGVAGGPDHVVSNYMLDMDFLGTILLNSARVNMDSSLVTMSRLIFEGQKIYDIKDSNRVGSGNDEKYIIYSSHRELDKEKFHVKRENTPLLKYDDFRYAIGNIQKDIENLAAFRNVGAGPEKKKDGGDVKAVERLNLIYDMPPNSDGYTDAFLNEMSEISNRKTKEGEPEQDVVMYLLFNSRSTLSCNMEWLERFLCTKNSNDIVFVFVYCKSNSKSDGIEKSEVQSMISSSGIGSLPFYFYEFKYFDGIMRFNDRFNDGYGRDVGDEDDEDEYEGVFHPLINLFTGYGDDPADMESDL